MSPATKPKSPKSRAKPKTQKPEIQEEPEPEDMEEPEAEAPKKRKTAEPPQTIDSAWFAATLQASGKSQRAAADLMGIQSASLNRAMKGKRKWNLDELMQFAGLVGVSATEILMRIGYKLPRKTAEIVGKVGEDGRVSTNTRRKGEKIESPSEVGPNCVCAIFETERTRLDAFNGMVVFWRPSLTLEPDAVGRFSVIELEEDPLPVVGVLRRLALGRYQVEPFGGVAAPIETTSVLRAAPILWTKTQ